MRPISTSPAALWIAILVSSTLGTLAILAAALPQVPPQPVCDPGSHQRLPFPLQQVAIHPSRLAHCFTPNTRDLALLDALRGYRCVVLKDLLLPGAGLVDLLLTRIDDVIPATISLHGAPPHAPGSPTPTPMSSWAGRVVNRNNTQVCFCFSSVGVGGWIRTEQKLFQMASFPRAGRWSDFRTLLVDDVDKNRIAGSRCGDIINELRLCTMALVTDYQFFQRFGDVAAAEVYAPFVIEAVAQQLRISAPLVIEVP